MSKQSSSPQSGPLVEDGVVVGTASNKYQMKNPIARYLLDGFDSTIKSLVSHVSPSSITEVGCGEGHVTKILHEITSAQIQALDISEEILRQAQSEVGDSDRVEFTKCSIYDIDAARYSADLVVCCEVLEHLEEPELGLQKLAELATPYALISVPREPIFRTMNFVRGAYVKDFGNSPGHIQHWSKTQFGKFISSEFEIIELRSPLPWTMVFARSKKA